jgi:hypothetical protein
METHEATLKVDDSEHYLSLKIENDILNVPLTKDEPNEIKKVFNKLIIHLKKGPLKFTMTEEEDGDLIYQVAKEYVIQLNNELSEVYQELEAHQLLEQKSLPKLDTCDPVDE